jgi:hypothetical protein
MWKWIVLALRVILGAAFVYAGVLKIQDPSEFAINVASFSLLPNLLISPMALALPPFEIITGLLLIIGVARRPDDRLRMLWQRHTVPRTHVARSRARYPVISRGANHLPVR